MAWLIEKLSHFESDQSRVYLAAMISLSRFQYTADGRNNREISMIDLENTGTTYRLFDHSGTLISSIDKQSPLADEIEEDVPEDHKADNERRINRTKLPPITPIEIKPLTVDFYIDHRPDTIVHRPILREEKLRECLDIASTRL